MTGIPFLQLTYLERIWRLRYFLCLLVQNDLTTRYRGSFLGIGWSLAKPLVMTSILCVVFGKLFNLPLTEYAPYLLIGTTTWQFVTESINQGCHSFALGAPFIRQQNVPLAIFPLRIVMGASFHFMIAFALAIVLTLGFRGHEAPMTLVLLVPAFIILFLLVWAFAIVAGVFHAHFPDTSNMFELALQLLFYVTPIIYRAEDMAHRGRVAACIQWNPFTSILALVRVPLLEGQVPAAEHYLFSLAFLAFVGALAIVLLRKLERTLVFWI